MASSPDFTLKPIAL
ncbi:Transposase [Caenorhabditis elegans]|nr:Transposase [Caenorhabditis elegans]CUV67109.1 Transposase [Caenorhabditis elegans]|eukprot:NP_001305196.1 Uncharacterized protein CELE_Y73C8B.9 [Caenorhabditis elegans]